MELKNYQRDVINNLKRYLALMNNLGDYAKAYKELWTEKNVRVGGYDGLPLYKDTIPKTPHVCFKVPTGGGKTFLACNSIRPIFDAMPLGKAKVVVWLVPSDAILEQTAKTLSDVNHPYRQRIDIEFGGSVEVITKQMALNGQNFNPTTVTENLTILILSYDSFRAKSKEGRKVYQENSALVQFSKLYGNTDSLIADCDETALAQILNWLSPLVIVDESHHATSNLSIDVLKNLNPCFILDLTATPKPNSNIIAYVDAMKLKAERMVKLPVIVYNRKTQKDVIRDAVDLRGNLERAAVSEQQNGGKYIRPIVLFQAQSNINSDSTTFEKIREILINADIPKDEIAIKTADVNEIKGIDLMSSDCKIRYIITVNALKEGWDCPFAYILATIANRSSSVDVEQILGRILRQPYTKDHKTPFLNMSYVITCSDDFRTTIDKVITGLNNAGFSKRDMRLGTDDTETAIITQDLVQTGTQATFDEIPNKTEEADIPDIDASLLRDELAVVTTNTTTPSTSVINMFETAISQSQEYNDVIDQNSGSEYFSAPVELRDKMNTYYINAEFEPEMNEIKLPQFFIKTEASLFTNENYTLLSKEALTDGFTLRDKNSEINFNSADEQIVKVDIESANGDTKPKSANLSEWDSKAFKQYFNNLPAKSRLKICKDAIHKQMNRLNNVDSADLSAYIDRIIDSLNSDQITDLETHIQSYSDKIKKKIISLQEEYSKSRFVKLLEQRKIICKTDYVFPEMISPIESNETLSKSLYSAEDGKMNDFEYKAIRAISSLENVKWWHRVTDRKGFYINGYINHYPDFWVMTKKGVVVAVETKGDFLDNPENKAKLELGRIWQNAAGSDKYAYFMVFENKDKDWSGAFYLDNFIEIIKEL